jgi:hypothetical protein
MNNLKMKEVILKVLEGVACGNTGSSQINLQSASAREMIANQLEPAITELMQEQISEAIEQVVCCRGDFRE